MRVSDFVPRGIDRARCDYPINKFRGPEPTAKRRNNGPTTTDTPRWRGLSPIGTPRASVIVRPGGATTLLRLANDALSAAVSAQQEYRRALDKPEHTDAGTAWLDRISLAGQTIMPASTTLRILGAAESAME
ncbi:hypothetical protein QN239_24205 [Mycolicibacterium sp. Y3]